MKLNQEKVIAFLKQAIPELQATYLFGSYADGTANQESDVDLAVLTLRPLSAGDLQFEVGPELADLLKVPSVDLIDLKSVSTIFQDEILKTGERIYVAEANFCDNYVLTAFSKAMDFRLFRAELVDDILKRGSVYVG